MALPVPAQMYEIKIDKGIDTNIPLGGAISFFLGFFDSAGGQVILTSPWKLQFDGGSNAVYQGVFSAIVLNDISSMSNVHLSVPPQTSANDTFARIVVGAGNTVGS